MPIITVSQLPVSAAIVSADQDVLSTLESIGLGEYAYDYGTLWVEAEDGEYVNVWGCAYLVPLDSDPVYHLYGNGASTWSRPVDNGA